MFSFRRHTDKRNGLNIDTREITLEPADNARLLSLCGPFDDNIKQLERRLGIEINRRDNHFKLTGRPICVTAAADILRSLYVDTAPMRGQIQDIEPEQIHLAIKEARVLEQSAESVPEYGKAMVLNPALESVIFSFSKAMVGRLLWPAVDRRWHGLRAVSVVADMISALQLRVSKARE